MNTLNNGTIVLGNSNEYAAILSQLKAAKEIKEGVNKVNLELHNKYKELLENIDKIIASWLENGKDVTRLQDLRRRVDDRDDALYQEDTDDGRYDSVYQKIEREIEKINEAIKTFSATSGMSGSSSFEGDTCLNSFIKELKIIIKEDSQNTNTEPSTEVEP